MVEVLGMQSMQALSLFNQTMGIKVLGDLNEFIRGNMLEPRNMELEFQELKKHLSTLMDAQRNIEKAEAQVRLLKPLQQHFQAFTEQSALGRQARQELDTARIWKNYTKYHLLDEYIRTGETETEALHRRAEETSLKAAALREDERLILNQLEQNKAGQRLQQLQKERTQLEAQADACRAALKRFSSWCELLRLEDKNPATEADWQRIKKEADRIDKRLATEIRNNNEDLYEAQDRQKKSAEEKLKLETELNTLLQSRNNIPVHLINLRRDMCSELKLDTSDLPFAGELMQVRADQSDWQPALEKLLNPLSLRLLVPDKQYKKVNRYVNNTNLRARLVYTLVKDAALRQHPDEGTVWHKLEFLADHPLSGWVSQQVIQQYNFSCVDSEKSLERYEKAITLQGLIKNRDRHEKDDRPGRNDPSRHVMGWNNEKKRETLQNRRAQLLTALEQVQEALQRANQRNSRLQEQVFAVRNIRDHSDFKSIDVPGVLRSIQHSDEQTSKLKKGSDQLKAVTQQLEGIREQLNDREREKDEIEKRANFIEYDLQKQAKGTRGSERLCQPARRNRQGCLIAIPAEKCRRTDRRAAGS